MPDKGSGEKGFIEVSAVMNIDLPASTTFQIPFLLCFTALVFLTWIHLTSPVASARLDFVPPYGTLEYCEYAKVLYDERFMEWERCTECKIGCRDAEDDVPSLPDCLDNAERARQDCLSMATDSSNNSSEEDEIDSDESQNCEDDHSLDVDLCWADEECTTDIINECIEGCGECPEIPSDPFPEGCDGLPSQDDL